MLALLKTIALLIVATLLAVAALLLPVHVRSLDILSLEYYADTEPTLQSKLDQTIRSAHVSPARRILRSTAVPDADLFEKQLDQIIAKRPSLALSGGPDRNFEDFLELIQSDHSLNQAKAVIPLLLPRSERVSISGLLEDSSNANVAALLDARDLSGLIRLHPASHAAGAPYDSGLLTLAMLIEGSHFEASLAQQIGTTATQAKLGTPAAVSAIEDLVIATLSLGRQLDYRSLADLATIAESAADWAQMATLYRAQPDRIDALFTALNFSQSSALVFQYLAAHPNHGSEDLQTALTYGPVATSRLLEASLPVYRPKVLASKTLPIIQSFRPSSFTRFAADHRETALGLKWALYVCAGLAFALAMGAAWRGSLRGIRPVGRALPAVLARDVFIGLVFALTIWAIFEPEILQSHNNETDSAPRIEFAVADSLQSLKQPVKAMQELNQVTLLVLALFFIVQLVIYCFCLIKLKEIGKQKLSSEMKLKLLENEENLFDFGLYVGLGGTVLSLILVAVGIVEASLMAAYASTLFGILFVAILKVLNLRPYRRRLIIEAGASNNQSGSGTLMKDIEL